MNTGRVLKNIAYKIPIIKDYLSMRKALEDVRSGLKITDNIIRIMIDEYTIKNMHNQQKYQNPKSLNRFEYQMYSQGDEDGIIAEIFKRIGTTDRFFIEFGISELENNSLALLIQDWKGVWIEADAKIVRNVKKRFSDLIHEQRLRIEHANITCDNIEAIFQKLKVPGEFDLLSIDIDGNDYWVWKAIANYRPRVVVIEYNAMFRPDIKWVMKYNPLHRHNGTSYYGASIKSLETLGFKKGYRLVGCNFGGVNAFFVREDLVKDKFLEPFTAKNHYEPPRYFLGRKTGNVRGFGDFVTE